MCPNGYDKMKFKLEEKKRLKCAVCHTYVRDNATDCKRCIDLGKKLNAQYE